MDLAKLVVRLEAQSAQLLAELDKTQNRILRFERNVSVSLARLNKQFSGFVSFGARALGAFAIAVSLQKIVTASGAAAKQMASLENAVERAGDAAGGRTAQDFARVSREIAGVTTVASGAVQNVQQLLLRFQNIRSDRFDEATARVLDLSQALGQDLDTAAKTVGRALADPIKGVTALGKAGVVFSDAQKKTLKDLVETGRRAEAQGIILDSLAKKFGGAAEAARGNFGGALEGVKNALGDLLEIDGGLPKATASMNELAKTLQDPAVRAGADALFSVIVRGASAAAQFLGETIAGLAILAGKGQDAAVNIDTQIRNLSERITEFRRQNPFPDAFGTRQLQEMTAELGKLTAKYNELQGLGLEGMKRAAQRTGKGGGLIPDGAFEFPDLEVVDQTAKLEELRKKLEAAGKAMTESLQTPYEKYNAQVALADKLLAANIITVETWVRALSTARAELDESNKSLGTMRLIQLSVAESTRQLQEELKAANPSEGLDAEIQKGIDAASDRIGKGLEEMLDKTTVFTEEASRNVQDILADGIVSGFDDGIDGLLDSFEDMLKKMAAQAIAADIAGAIFGTDGVNGKTQGWLGQFTDWLKGLGSSSGSSGAPASSGGGGGGGFWDAILNFGASLFTADNGGHVQAGTPVLIGKRAQPELWLPDTAGTMYPAGTYGGGGANVTQNIYTSSPITQRSARQIEVETARQQRIATGRFG